jgi:GDPmannose 4,6-dehydratase
MRAIIFGSNGQDGFFLNSLLKKNGLEIINVSRKNGATSGDVSDYNFVQNLIKYNKPDFIFNFAANSSTRHDLLFENHQTIESGTLNILESVRLFSPNSKVFIPGSALQFKNTGEPINEQSEFEASSAYALARIQSTYAVRYYKAKFGLQLYMGYFFNHDSQLRSEQHVNQKIVKAAQRISLGVETKLVLGNMEVRKEFNFAGDVVEAIWALVNQNNLSEAVIGCGMAYSIKDWVELCFGNLKLDWRNYIEIETDYLPEYNILVSDPTLIKSIGWMPKTNLYNLAKIMMG